MPETTLPVALRATAYASATRLLRRPRRAFRYDAEYADGWVVLDVDASEVLQAARYPADASVTQHAAQDGCPEVGTGPWVGYASGLLHRPPYDAEVETLVRAIEIALEGLGRAGHERLEVGRADLERRAAELLRQARQA